jgi:hypothetical protein
MIPRLNDGAVSAPIDTPDAILVVKAFDIINLERAEVAAEIGKKLEDQERERQMMELKTKADVWMNGATSASCGPQEPGRSSLRPCFHP